MAYPIYAWTTHRELEFLFGLGEHIPEALRGGRPTRKECLERYAESFEERANWDHVDKTIVRIVLELLLAGRDDEAKHLLQ